MDPALEKSAARHLSQCKCLSDAEHYFEAHGKAVAWGLFDGYRGYPATVAGVSLEHHAAYYEAVEVGERIRRTGK